MFGVSFEILLIQYIFNTIYLLFCYLGISGLKYILLYKAIKFQYFSVSWVFKYFVYPSRIHTQGSNIPADPPAVLRWVWCMAYACVGLFIPWNNLPIVYQNNKTIFCVWSGCQTKQNKWRTPGVCWCQACCELARFYICFGLAESRVTFSVLRAHPSFKNQQDSA